jgi:cytochrome c oxidase assembly protein subunit 15/protoheme IX farnesyltransferase
VSQRAFVRLAIATLSASVLVIVWGGVVRATGSGAGCGSHWPLCNGVMVPLAPRTATVIEFVHRLSSGAAMIMALALVLAAWRVFPAGHRARIWAMAALVFMLIEAAVGAGLVLLRLVENNASALRAGYIVVHLTNTMMLVGAITGTLWWGSQPIEPATPRIVRSGRLTATLVALIAVSATGAIVALGDTLFPSASLAQGFAADLSSTSHFLIRLRAVHPALAAAVALVILALSRRDPSFVSRSDSLRGLVVTLVLAQAGLGIMNLVMLAPLPLQMAHLLGANLLWIGVVWAWMGTSNSEFRI